MLVARPETLQDNSLNRLCRDVGLRVYDRSVPVGISKGVEEWGFRLVYDANGELDAIDTLIVSDDSVAKGITQGALARGVRVPEDLLIITLANHDIDMFFPLPVLRLDVDLESLVVRAGDLLLRNITDPELPPQTVLVTPELESWAGIDQSPAVVGTH